MLISQRAMTFVIANGIRTPSPWGGASDVEVSEVVEPIGASEGFRKFGCHESCRFVRSPGQGDAVSSTRSQRCFQDGIAWEIFDGTEAKNEARVEALFAFAKDVVVQATSRRSCPLQEVGVNQVVSGR